MISRIKNKPRNRYHAVDDIDYDGKTKQYTRKKKDRLDAYFVKPPRFLIKPILSQDAMEL